MASAPVSIKLRCSSWKQLMAIYRRDLLRSAVFLKSKNPPPVGTKIKINLSLPSDSLVVLDGAVKEHVPPGGLDGRGPGVDIALDAVPQSAMWLIETALASAAGNKGGSAVRRVAEGSAKQARARSAGPPTHVPGRTPAAQEASLDDGSDVVDAESKLIDALGQELESLRKLNPFQVLGVGYDTSDEAVRAAFGQLTKRYHPDRYARFESNDARALAAEIFILIRDAYRRLGNIDARQRTVENLRQQRAKQQRKTSRAATSTPPPAKATPAPAKTTTPPPTPGPPPSPARGGAGLDLGDLFTKRGESAGEAPIELAAERQSFEHSYSDAAGLIEAGKYDEALAIYKLSSRKNPGDRIARAGVELAEGLKALAERDRLEAAQRFEAVLELDPTNERAARELAEMRRQATNERKGLLSRLLGKKE